MVVHGSTFDSAIKNNETQTNRPWAISSNRIILWGDLLADRLCLVP